MKRMFTRMAAVFTRINAAIDRLFDAYSRAIADTRGTPAFAYLCESAVMQ